MLQCGLPNILGFAQPTEFENRKQGPVGKKHKPLQHMTGSGSEFPVTRQKGGYQGGDPGTVRAITQKDRDGAPIDWIDC